MAARRFIASVLVASSLLASPAHAGVSTVEARARVVRPLSLVKTGDLDFGGVLPSAAAGSVRIDPATDASTTSGGAALAGGSPRSARLVAAGVANALVVVALGSAPVLSRTGGGATMSMTNLTLDGPTTRVLPPSGTLDVRIGGTLAVAANQADGDYVGTFDVTVMYL